MPGQLHLAAAQEDYKELVRLVEEEKIDVNEPDENKIYPIEHAVINHRIENVKYLLTAAKADITKTPHLLEKAIRLGDESLTHLLAKKFLDKGLITELSHDFYIGYLENIMDSLFQHPEKILEKDKLGRSLLYWISLTTHEVRFKEIILQHKVFTRLTDEEKDELLRDLAKGQMDSTKYLDSSEYPFCTDPVDSYYTQLKISKYTDEDYRAFANLRLKHIENSPSFVIQNLEKIKSPTTNDYFNLVDAYTDLGVKEWDRKSFESAFSYLGKIDENCPGYYYHSARLCMSMTERWQNIKLIIDTTKEAISFLNRCTPNDMTTYSDYFQTLLSYCKKLSDCTFSYYTYHNKDSVNDLENLISIAQSSHGEAADKVATLLSTGPKKNLNKALQYYSELGRTDEYQRIYNNCQNELIQAITHNNLIEFSNRIKQDSYPLDNKMKRVLLSTLYSLEPEKMSAKTKQEFIALILPTKKDVPAGVPQCFYEFAQGKDPNLLLAEIKKAADFDPQFPAKNTSEDDEDFEKEFKENLDENITNKLALASFESSAKLLEKCKHLLSESESIVCDTQSAEKIKKDKIDLALQYFSKASELGFSPETMPFSPELLLTDKPRTLIKFFHNDFFGNSNEDLIRLFYEDYLKPIATGDLYTIQQLLDDKYPFKEHTKDLINAIINSNQTAVTQYEMLCLFISRGMECPLTLPFVEFFENTKIEIAKKINEINESLRCLPTVLVSLIGSYTARENGLFQKPREPKPIKLFEDKTTEAGLRM